MIGDRPDKDIVGAARVGIRGIRVRTGEYRSRPDHPDTWLSARTFADAVLTLPASEPRGYPRRAATPA